MEKQLPVEDSCICLNKICQESCNLEQGLCRSSFNAHKTGAAIPELGVIYPSLWCTELGSERHWRRECWGSQSWFRVASEIPGSLPWYGNMKIHLDEWGVSGGFQGNRCKGKVLYHQLAQEGESRGFPSPGGKQLLQSHSWHFYINWSACQLGFHLHPHDCFKQFFLFIGLFSSGINESWRTPSGKYFYLSILLI